MDRLYFDVETRWVPDLGKHGVVRCATSPLAGINCLTWALNNEALITADYFDCTNPLVFAQKHPRFMNAFNDPNCKKVAHNAQFEMAVMLFMWLWKVRPTEWIDTMAKCAYYGLPRGLDDAAQALKLTQLKDLGGKAVMLRLVNPVFTPHEVADDFNRLYHYNRIDCSVLRGIDKSLPDLPPFMQELWELDAEINFRGMPIDMRAVNNAVELKAILAAEANQRMAELTGGYVTTVGQTERIEQWAFLNGAYMVDCTADTVVRMLADPSLPSNVRAVLELRQEAGLSSLAKYEAMHRFEVGGRLYFMADWFGAHTGRPTGNGPQMLNLPRAKDAATWAERLADAPYIFRQIAKPLERMKESARGIICAPDGKAFVGVDLAQIEARATAYVAADQGLLKLFRDFDKGLADPYCTYGQKIFNRVITAKDNPVERTASKATVLAYGFAGGIGAGQRVGENYKIDFTEMAGVILVTATPPELAEGQRCYEYYMDGNPLKPLSQRNAIAVDILKQRYRRDFPDVVKYWDILEQAFLLGGWAGPIHVRVEASGLRVITLPSGRQMFYHGVTIHNDQKYSYRSRHGRTFLWKGTLIENVAQGINFDVSEYYKLRANREIAPVVHHCYDEFTLECEAQRAEEVKRQLEQLTKGTRPDWTEGWAGGLPLGFDYWTDKRYG